MDPKDAVLIAVQEEGPEGLTGKTLLQKKLYFASLLVKEDLGFRPHYYGPYSQQVADATDSLVSNRFFEEQIEIFPEANIFGERRRHSYEPTEDGRRLLETIKERPEVAPWRDALRKINEHPFARDFNLLSIAAKVMNILSKAGKARVDEIERKAKEHGWELSGKEIESVVEFLEYLGLAKRRR